MCVTYVQKNFKFKRFCQNIIFQKIPQIDQLFLPYMAGTCKRIYFVIFGSPELSNTSVYVFKRVGLHDKRKSCTVVVVVVVVFTKI